MSFQHHSQESELQRRFLEELEGKAKRRWPDGRVGPNDDGETAYAIATDKEHGIIRIEFTRAMDWIGLDLAAAKQLRDALTERIMELKGIEAP